VDSRSDRDDEDDDDEYRDEKKIVDYLDENFGSSAAAIVVLDSPRLLEMSSLGVCRGCQYHSGSQRDHECMGFCGGRKEMRNRKIQNMAGLISERWLELLAEVKNRYYEDLKRMKAPRISTLSFLGYVVPGEKFFFFYIILSLVLSMFRR